MDKDAIIKKLVEENKLLTEHIKLLEEKIQLLEEHRTKLEERIAQLEKNSNNSSKPPSSDIVKPLKLVRRLGKKRKRGGQHGHRKFSRQPFESEQVDEIIEYEFKDKDAEGLKPLGRNKKVNRLLVTFFGCILVLSSLLYARQPICRN